jgi:hypothetical protein
MVEPGGFHDEDGTSLGTYTADDLEEQFREARDTKQTLITQASSSGAITEEYARLLHTIRSGTHDEDLITLEKVQAALSLRDELTDTFQHGSVAYIGSGLDWQFAVALGAREIDMVDPTFGDQENREALLRTIQMTDPQASLGSEEAPVVDFGINLGSGVERIQLRLLGVDVRQYNPSSLAGVIEIAGPTKGEGFAPMSPLLPNVQKGLSPGAKVVNFDYMRQRVANGVPQGFQSKSVGKFTVLSAA